MAVEEGAEEGEEVVVEVVTQDDRPCDLAIKGHLAGAVAQIGGEGACEINQSPESLPTG